MSKILPQLKNVAHLTGSQEEPPLKLTFGSEMDENILLTSEIPAPQSRSSFYFSYLFLLIRDKSAWKSEPTQSDVIYVYYKPYFMRYSSLK